MTDQTERTADGAWYSFACATADITPQEPTMLAGYSDRIGLWNSVSSRLEVNAVLLDDGSAKVILLSADILYFGPDLDERLRSHAAGLGLGDAELVLAASHTHFAPATDASKPQLGKPDSRYLECLQSTLLGLIDTVVSAPRQRVRLESAVAQTVGINVNRRRRWPLPTVTRAGVTLPPVTIMAPNERAPCDRALDAVRVIDGEGQLLALLWKFTCHPVGFPDLLSVNSEYPGRAREALRRAVGRDIPVVFWQGFSGDVRPALIGRKSWMERFQALRRGPSFGSSVSRAEWDAWSMQISCAMVTAATSPATRTSGKLLLSSARVPLTALIEQEADPARCDRTLLIQRLAFGEGLAVLFVAAEACSPYLKLLENGSRTIFVGYTGDVFGYLPSADQAREGGYEGGGFFRLFDFAGGFRPGFEEKIVAAAQRLAA